jgi:hypothetical protein
VITLIALGVALLLAASLGVSKRFLRGLFRGTDVYVVVSDKGKTVVYKNPNRPYVHKDRPLEETPHEILSSDKYESFYNVCWFDSGTLFRCEHTFHSSPEDARRCEKSDVADSFIGKVLEER